MTFTVSDVMAHLQHLRHGSQLERAIGAYLYLHEHEPSTRILAGRVVFLSRRARLFLEDDPTPLAGDGLRECQRQLGAAILAWDDLDWPFLVSDGLVADFAIGSLHSGLPSLVHPFVSSITLRDGWICTEPNRFGVSGVYLAEREIHEPGDFGRDTLTTKHAERCAADIAMLQQTQRDKAA